MKWWNKRIWRTQVGSYYSDSNAVIYFNNRHFIWKRERKCEWKFSCHKLLYEMNKYTCAGFTFAYLLIYLIYNASSEIYVLYALHFPYFLLNVSNRMTYDAYGIMFYLILFLMSSLRFDADFRNYYPLSVQLNIKNNLLENLQ